MTRWCVASVFLAVALLCATCSEATPVTDAPPAPSTWRFLDSGRTDYFGDDTTDIELRGSFVEIDNVAIPDTVDFETEVVLIIGTNAGADKPGPCGPPQYTDLAFAPGSITISLPPFDSANDVSCPAVDSPGRGDQLEQSTDPTLRFL